MNATRCQGLRKIFQNSHNKYGTQVNVPDAQQYQTQKFDLEQRKAYSGTKQEKWAAHAPKTPTP